MKILRLICVIFVASELACSHNSSPTNPTTTTKSSTVSILTPSTLALAVGDSTQVRAVLIAAGNTEHLITSGTWVSANDAVATVTNAGVVTARAPGSAKITVTVTEGTATVAVTVSNQSQPTTFVGGVAGPSAETATFRFTFASQPILSGTVYFRQDVFSLVGRYDDPTHVVDLAGGGFSFLGVVNGNVLTGSYVDPAGFTGGFTAIDATHTAVTTFCGSYTSDGTTVAGNSDSGAMVLSVSSDGTAAASALVSDTSRAPQAFTGRNAAGGLSLISPTGQTLQGQLQSETATGGFVTAGAASATFSISSSACH